MICRHPHIPNRPTSPIPNSICTHVSFQAWQYIVQAIIIIGLMSKPCVFGTYKCICNASVFAQAWSYWTGTLSTFCQTTGASPCPYIPPNHLPWLWAKKEKETCNFKCIDGWHWSANAAPNLEVAITSMGMSRSPKHDTHDDEVPEKSWYTMFLQMNQINPPSSSIFAA